MNEILQATMLVVALSMDSLTAGFSYGAGKIKLPLNSIIVISAICCASLGISMFFGVIIGGFVSAEITKGIAFAIMFILGSMKVFDSALKRYIIRKNGGRKQLAFKAFDLNFILNIYAEPSTADSDLSRVLSVKEAVYLALALSIDSLAVGFGAGLGQVGIIGAIFLCFIATFVSIATGSKLGNILSAKLPDVSPIGGILLIVLAFLRL